MKHSKGVAEVLKDVKVKSRVGKTKYFLHVKQEGTWLIVERHNSDGIAKLFIPFDMIIRFVAQIPSGVFHTLMSQVYEDER